MYGYIYSFSEFETVTVFYLVDDWKCKQQTPDDMSNVCVEWASLWNVISYWIWLVTQMNIYLTDCAMVCPLALTTVLLLFWLFSAFRWLFFLLFILLFWNQILTCLSVRFRFLASSHLFCLETYALKRNSFSSSNVWNFE